MGTRKEFLDIDPGIASGYGHDEASRGSKLGG
jgi:hypothetical protein